MSWFKYKDCFYNLDLCSVIDGSEDQVIHLEYPKSDYVENLYYHSCAEKNKAWKRIRESIGKEEKENDPLIPFSSPLDEEYLKIWKKFNSTPTCE